MGLLAVSARQNFITIQKMDLKSEEVKLRNELRKISDKRANSLMPLEAPDAYQKDSNGNYITNTDGTRAVISKEEYDKEYQEYITNYYKKENTNELVDQKLLQEEQKINIRLANINVQVQSLDAEQENISKSIDASVKRIFGVG